MSTTTSPENGIPTQPTPIPSAPPPNVLQTHCGRNALMQGIVTGVGVGFIRKTTTPSVFLAAQWAWFSFVGISAVSWHLCNRRMEREREQVINMIERTKQQRTVTYEDETT